MKGIVYKSTGSWYDVKAENGTMYACRLKGKLRLDDLNTTNPVAVGDVVHLEHSNDDLVIQEIEPRKNYIVRESPKHKHARHIIAANLDQAILMATISSPRTSSGFIDRFLVMAEAYEIPVILLFNKKDALQKKDISKLEHLMQVYNSLQYKTYSISCFDPKDIELIRDQLYGKTSLLSGHSGVGKSTFINALQPELSLRTGDISAKHDKGTHTTTFAEVIELNTHRTLLIDTPGIKEFGILGFEPEEISGYFREMKQLLIQCKFNNCMHIDEPGCAVKEAVASENIDSERYENYCKMVEDYKSNFKYWERNSK